MKSTIQDNANITGNSKQLAILKSNFPECFDKNGVFIASKLQEIVQASGVEVSKESYGINWLGKSYARLLANQNPQTLLKANKAHNELPDNANSQNMLIKGDNLEVLKHLVGGYREQVKMIYIDPPYNTGSDGFVYQDDRKFTVAQLSHLAGIDETEAKRILEFTQSKSNSHSAWLTFMYPRLYIAKQLLKDEGVILISIDENEHAQLKILCNEIFNEENFAGDIIWKNSSKNDQSYISVQHEYILCYVKNKNINTGNWLEKKEGIEDIYKVFEKFKQKHGNSWEKIHEESLTWYKQFTESNPISNSKHYNWMDERGVYFASDISGPNFGQYRYPVTHPLTGKICKEPASGWRFPEETMLLNIKNNLIHFGVDETTIPNNKTYLKNTEYQSLTSIKYKDGRVASKLLKTLLEGNYFTNPKDIELLKGLFKSIGVSDTDIILDFFAGSGTTAHTVMQLNAEDGGSRQFICVQLDEKTDPKKEAYKAGYKSIYDITEERIKRAAARIRTDFPLLTSDFGFKQFETIPVFDGYLDEPEELTPNLELFDVTKLSQEDRHNLMLTWQVQDNIPLTQSLTVVDLVGYKAYQGKHILYFIEPNITLDAVIKLLEQLDNNPLFAPRRVVVLGYLLDSKIQREMTEAIKHYNNRKGIELTLDIRF